MSLNKVFLMGRITKDLEKKTTPSGVSVLNTTIAVDRDFKNGDDKVTDFIDVVFWRHNADFLEKFSGKGRMIVVVGSLQSRKWQDKDGNNRTSWEVQAENVYFADSKRDGGGQSTAEPTGAFTELADGAGDGELPF